MLLLLTCMYLILIFKFRVIIRCNTIRKRRALQNYNSGIRLRILLRVFIVFAWCIAWTQAPGGSYCLPWHKLRGESWNSRPPWHKLQRGVTAPHDTSCTGITAHCLPLSQAPGGVMQSLPPWHKLLGESLPPLDTSHWKSLPCRARVED